MCGFGRGGAASDAVEGILTTATTAATQDVSGCQQRNAWRKSGFTLEKMKPLFWDGFENVRICVCTPLNSPTIRASLGSNYSTVRWDFPVQNCDLKYMMVFQRLAIQNPPGSICRACSSELVQFHSVCSSNSLRRTSRLHCSHSFDVQKATHTSSN